MTDNELRAYLEDAEKNPRQIAATVSGLHDKVLRYKPAPDKWSILEVLGHIADIEIVYAKCSPILSPISRPWTKMPGQSTSDIWKRPLPS